MSSWATKSIIIYNLYPKVQNLPKLGQTMIRLGWTSQMYQLHQLRPQKAWEVGHPSVQPPVMAQKLSRDCKAFHRPAAVSAMLLLTGVSRWCDVYYHNNCWYHLNSVYLNCLWPFIIVVVIETSPVVHLGTLWPLEVVTHLGSGSILVGGLVMGNH